MPRILRFQTGQEDAVAAEVAAVLKTGALVVIPTETVYGVVADAGRKGSEERLCQAKTRDRGKPLQLLAGSVGKVEVFGAELTSVERAVVEAFWPGPLTLVLRVKGGKPEGFRIPEHELARQIVDCTGGMLRASSANLSGNPPALTAEDAIHALGESVELVVDAGPIENGVASTVVRMTEGELEVLREGSISKEALMEVISRNSG